MRSTMIVAIAMGLSLLGCEIFFPKVGGKGQDCADNGACDEGLVCNFDECVKPLEEGEECDSSMLDEMDFLDEDTSDAEPWMLTCEEGYCCEDGECAESVDWVKQPDSDREWTKCPGDSEWEGCACCCSMGEEFVNDYNGYFEIMGICKGTNGLRLPSVSEYLTLLGGCEAAVLAGGEGFCNPCSESDACSEMFGFMDDRDDVWFFTGDWSQSGSDYILWLVNLGSGEVQETYAEYSLKKATSLCILQH